MKIKYEYIKEKMGVLSGYFSDKVKNTSDSFEKLIMDAFAEGYHKGLVEGFEIKKEWIPVSERLPQEKEKEYLVYTNTGYICACRWTDDIYGLDVHGEFGWHIIDKPQYTKVIAWMPLPEPYKAGEEE